MTREKYESLPLATLKELAKARKMKGVSTLKKADLIEAMISLDEQEDQEKLSEQKESSQEHLKEMQNQNREEKAASELKENKEHREAKDKKPETDMEQLDSGCSVSGILEIMPTVLDLSEVTTIFREKMTYMSHLHRSAGSDLKQEIYCLEIQGLKRRVKNSAPFFM